MADGRFARRSDTSDRLRRWVSAVSRGGARRLERCTRHPPVEGRVLGRRHKMQSLMEREQSESRARQSCGRAAAELRQSCGRAAAELRQSYGRATSELQRGQCTCARDAPGRAEPRRALESVPPDSVAPDDSRPPLTHRVGQSNPRAYRENHRRLRGSDAEGLGVGKQGAGV